MKLFHFTLLTMILVGIPSVTAASVNPGDSTSTCESLLAAAEEAGSRAHGSSEAANLYPAAFKACDRANLSPGLTARVAFQRGNYLHLYDKDIGAAIRVYEKALDDLSSLPEAESAHRVKLLDGLASALESRAGSGEQEAASGDRLRAINVREESLAVRRAVYGPGSPQAVRGLLLLAFTHLPNEPHLAEEYVSEALVVVKAGELAPEAAAETFSALASVYRQQGRLAEANAASERAGELFDKAFPGETQP